MRREVDYLDLAKQARLEGKPELVWFYFRNHARVMRKKWQREQTKKTPNAAASRA